MQRRWVHKQDVSFGVMALAGAIARPFGRAPIGSTPPPTYSKISTVSIVGNYLDFNALKFLVGDAVDFADSSVLFRKIDK